MNTIKKRIAILYTGNIHPDLKHWNGIAHNHIKLLTLLFPPEENQVDFFFVVDQTDTTKLLTPLYYKENTVNVVCTNTGSAWKKTSVADLGKMSPSRIEEFEDRIRRRGFNPKAIWNIKNMEQFHKLSIAIKLKKEVEALSSIRYDKCVRIRPDIMFNTDMFEEMRQFVSKENYLMHLNDLFFIGSSNMFDSIIDILDDVYTIEENIVDEFMPNIDAYPGNNLRRLFPEVQFMTVVCKHAPTGKYDLSWNISHPHEWTKYMRIVRFHE
jgi:hypothetical protein